MEDIDIVELFFKRSERALSETGEKYGAYCRAIAMNILSSPLDAEETVQDALMGAWQSIPPNRPGELKSYMGKITRRLSLKKYRDLNRLKRGGGSVTLALEELGDSIPDGTDIEREIDLRELKDRLNAFLGGLDRDTRDMFVLRYWYFEPLESIADELGCSESRVKSSLYRTRKKLMLYLQKEGLYES